jgi:hypothetical protein
MGSYSISYEQWAEVNYSLNDAVAKNKDLLKQIEELTKERNKYRSQAIMRQNKIESLLNDI